MLQEYLSIDRTVSMSLLASEQHNVLKTASKHNATIYNISNKSQHSHSCKCHPPMEWSQVCMKLPYTDLSFIHTHTIGGVIIDNALPTHLMMLYQLI